MIFFDPETQKMLENYDAAIKQWTKTLEPFVNQWAKELEPLMRRMQSEETQAQIRRIANRFQRVDPALFDRMNNCKLGEKTRYAQPSPKSKRISGFSDGFPTT